MKITNFFKIFPITEKLKEYFIILLLYLVLTLFFFKGILFSRGVLIGGDWNFPQTQFQMTYYSNSGLYTWSYITSLFGDLVQNSNDYLNRIILGHLPFSEIIGGGTYSKIFIISIIVFAAFSLYCYSRFLKLGKISSFIGGFFLVTSPLVFDYTCIGWTSVIIALGLLPITLMFFELSLNKNKIVCAIISGLLFSLAIWQAQSLVWYPLTFILLSLFKIKSKNDLIAHVQSLVIVGAVFLSINLIWILPTIFFPSNLILSSINSVDKMLFGARINEMNLIRLWGGLYNYQYETSYPSGLIYLSFIPPLVAYLSLLLKRDDYHVYFLTGLSLVPLILYCFRFYLSYLPFSSVIRDYSRFLFLSTFAFSVLISITIDTLLTNKSEFLKERIPKNYLKMIGYVLIILILVVPIPFWMGEIYNSSKDGQDIRLRTLDFHSDYSNVESMLMQESGSFKILYLPIGGMGINMNDNPEFNGSYHEIADIYSAFSAHPGWISRTDRGIGLAQNFSLLLEDEIDSSDENQLSDLCSLANIKYIVVRKDMTNDFNNPFSMNETDKKINNNSQFEKVYNGSSISVYKNVKDSPLIYPAGVILSINGNVGNFLYPHNNQLKWINNTAYFFSDDAPNRNKFIFHDSNTYKLDSETNSLPEIRSLTNFFELDQNRSNIKQNSIRKNYYFISSENVGINYTQMNPTKYSVRFNASHPFYLVFSETFNPNWKIFPNLPINNSVNGSFMQQEEISQPGFTPADLMYFSSSPIDEKFHFEANGYANAWYIDPNNFTQNNNGQSELIIYYTPQSYYYLGFILSCISLIFCILYLLIAKKE